MENEEEEESSPFIVWLWYYWKLLASWAGASTRRDVDMKSRLRELILSIVILAVLITGTLSLYVPDTVIQAFLGDLRSSIRLGFLMICVLIVALFILFMIRFVIIEPVNLFKKQMEIIADYKKKQHLAKSTLLYFEADKGTDNRGNWAGILVSNDGTNTMLNDPILTIETIEGEVVPRLPSPIELHLRGQNNIRLNYLSPGGAPCLFDLAISLTSTLDGGAIKTKVTKSGIQGLGRGLLHLMPGTYKIKTRLIGAFYSSPLDIINPRDQYWILIIGDDNSLDLRKAYENGS